MKKIFLILLVLFGVAVYGQRERMKVDRYNPDKNGDLKVDTSELKYWTGDVSYYYNNGFAESYLGHKLGQFIASFDENKDGRFSNLEFRRFQTGAKKLFSDAYEVLEEEFDENKNRRLDKEERITAMTKVKGILNFALSIKEGEEEGRDAEEVLERKRGLNDIYD